jgi:trehalose 6-phosphate phosphatase
VVFDGNDAEGVRESLCTLGNGYLATRGTAPEHRADGSHYPGTYVAGCYNRLRDTVLGEVIENESVVNLPNWLPLTFRIEDGPWLGQQGCEVLTEQHELDLARGLLVRRLRVRDAAGRVTSVTQRRLIHLRQPHICALQTTIEPSGWSGPVAIASTLDTTVENLGVARYRGLASHHLTAPVRAERVGDETVLCVLETNQSHIRIAMAARTRLLNATGFGRQDIVSKGQLGEELIVDMTDGTSITAEKVVTVYTSRDPAISAPEESAIRQLAWVGDFDELLTEHALAWNHVWRRFHLGLAAAGEAALTAVRLHLFHVLQTLSVHSGDADVGVPARGLHGEAYRGHVLWDELFVLPILSLRLPEVSRGLLLYRYRRLAAARQAARALGKVGAMYPWQSASTGGEESQRLHLNPVSGRWVEDLTERQRHIGLAVAHNTWQYCQATGDLRFLDQYGAEMIIEVARFFADIAEYDAGKRRYVIRGVMGPDEFHTGYPGGTAEGIDNNAYTNVMVVWLLLRAADALAALAPDRRQELRETLGLTAAEEQRWQDICRRMYVPFHDGLISQFEGYERLEELDWDSYRNRYGDIRRLDRILEAEGDDPNRYRASKQADVLMLLYVFSADELRDLLRRLGYALPSEVVSRMVDYYLARTSHGSTLSTVVHAWVLARSRRAQALTYLAQTLTADSAEVSGGSTAEGVHLAAMAGSIDLLQRCFAGVETRGDTLFLNPYWPRGLGALELDVHYRHHRLRLRITEADIRVTSAPGDHHPIQVHCRGREVTLQAGGTVQFSGAWAADAALAADESSVRFGATLQGGRSPPSNRHGRRWPSARN